MRAWTVRAGSDGENEELDLNQGIVVIGWSETGDLTGVKRERLREILIQHHPDAEPETNHQLDRAGVVLRADHPSRRLGGSSTQTASRDCDRYHCIGL